MSLFRAVSHALTPGRPRPAEARTPPPASSADEAVLLATFMTSWDVISYTLRSPELRHEPLESTDLATNIESLLDCLVMESNLAGAGPSSPSADAGTTGDCLEMLLKADIPSQLVSLTLPDQPQGSKGLIITFFSSLVVLMDEHFISHAKVHKPLVRLLRSCVEPDDDPDLDDAKGGGWRTKDRAYEEGVVEIMCHVCSRIKTFPELLAVFLHERTHAAPANWPSSPTAPTFASLSVYTPSPPRKSVHFSPERTDSPTPSSSTTPKAPASSATLRPPSRTISPVASTSASASATSTLSDTVSSSRRPAKDPEMLIFSYLLRFVHREGRTGDMARAGLLFLMEVAMGRKVVQAEAVSAATASSRRGIASTQVQVEAALTLAEWVLDSDFSDVLGAGLGAAYGLLPSKLVVRDKQGAQGPGTDGVLDILDGQDADATTMLQGTDEDEELRMKMLGLGFSDSTDFRTQFALFIKLLEFAQDVLRRAPMTIAQVATPSPSSGVRALSPSVLSNPDSSSVRSSASLLVDAGSPSRSAELIAGAITSAVLTSTRRLFLSSILYPSLLECSEADGSAVAVMSYLEAMLSLLKTDGRLADVILRYLLSEDDEDEDEATKSPPSAASQLKKRAKQRRRRRRASGALRLIRAETEKAGLTPTDYATAWGRFTLKDLLATNVRSRDPATAAAALRLLTTVVTKHDRYALVLLDVAPDPDATAFPFLATVLDPAAEPSTASKQEEDLPSSMATIRPPTAAAVEEDGESEDEEFVYPGASDGLTVPTTPLSAARLARQVLSSPAPTYDAHRDDIEGFASLIETIDNVPSELDAAGGDEASSATAWERYLVDAEVEVTANTSFQRGISAAPEDVAFQQASCPQPVAPASPEDPFGSPKKASAGGDKSMDALLDAPLLRHKLAMDSPVMIAILDSLASFFSRPPEVNLALTGVLAGLAACPTRSLEGWLIPSRDARTRSEGPLERVLEEMIRTPARGTDVEEKLEGVARARMARTPRSKDLDLDDEDVPAVIGIYAQLAEQVRTFRKELPEFDRFLTERKDGLRFAENLADALDGDAPEASFAARRPAGPDGQTTASTPAMSPKPAMERAKDSFVSWFTPTKKDSPAPSPTPASRARFDPPDGAARDRASPFAKHYEQTRGIRVTPKKVATPLSKRQLRNSSLAPGDLDTPTKKGLAVATALTDDRASFVGLDADAGLGMDEDDVEGTAGLDRVEQDVSLSRLLGNVVLLEESIKELAAIVCARRSLGIDPVRVF